MQPDRHAERLLRGRDAGDVIEMGVGQQDVADREPVLLDRRQELVDLVAGVDDDALAGVLAADDESVLEERGRLRVSR